MRVKESVRGYSLLEFAASLMIVMPLIVGAFDLSNIFHGYSVAKRATTETLRCLYVTDGSCSTASYTPPESTVRWTGIPSALSYQKATFQGSVSYIGAPAFDVGPAYVRVLDRVHYQLQADDYTVNSDTDAAVYPLLQDVQYSQLSVSAPVIRPSNTGDYRDANFQLPSGASYPRVGASISGSSDRTLAVARSSGTDTNVISYSFSNTVPQWCYVNGALAPCTNGTVQAVMHVRGSLSGSADNSCGEVLLSVNGKSVGGQAFRRSRNDNNGNFFPRGNLLSAPRGESYPKELTDSYNRNVVLTLGSANQITLALNRLSSLNGSPCTTTGSLNWELSGVDLYLPQFTTTRVERTCTETVTNCQALPAACTVPGFSTETFVGSYRKGATPVSSIKTSCTGHGTSPEEAFANLSENCKAAVCVAGRLGKSPTSESVVRHYDAACPSIAVPEQPDARGEIRASPLAEALCPPLAYKPAEVYWTEKEVLASTASRRWVKESCHYYRFESVGTLGHQHSCR